MILKLEQFYCSTLDEEDDDTNSQSRIHLIVSECWVEAQNGNVCNVFDQADHFLQDLNYHQIYQAVSFSFFLLVA